jgi:hypothetical protein
MDAGHDVRVFINWDEPQLVEQPDDGLSKNGLPKAKDALVAVANGLLTTDMFDDAILVAVQPAAQGPFDHLATVAATEESNECDDPREVVEETRDYSTPVAANDTLPVDETEEAMIVAPLVVEAEAAMRSLIVSLSNENVCSNILARRDCSTASSMRGLLLGRSKTDGASWDELWIARLQHQIPYISVTFDDSTGVVSGISFKPRDEVPITVTEAVDRLTKATEVIVQSLIPALRIKMLHKDGSFRRTLVEHMFNLQRKTTPVYYSTISVDYGSHCMLIQNCLENAVKKSSCGKKDALKAHLQMTKDKALSTDVLSNLNSMTEGFGQFLETRLSAQPCYLDLLTPGSVPVNTATTGPGSVSCPSRLSVSGTPKIRTYQITPIATSKTPGGFRVWVIDDPISPRFKERLIARLNELSFMVGVGGKSGAYVRNASTCTTMPTPVVIGGDIVYASEPASAIELEILSIANKIAAMQYDYVKTLVGRDYKVTFHCNLIHTVVGSLLKSMYAPHSDYGQLLCTAENSTAYQHVEDNKWLPKRDEMQVITLVISNSSLPTSTELVYSQGSSQLVSIPLNSCCIHIQGPGSQQSGIKHAARVKGSTAVDDGRVWRASITLRFSVGRVAEPNTFRILLGEMLLQSVPPPPSEWISSYDTKNVIDLLTSFEHVDSPGKYDDDNNRVDTNEHMPQLKKAPSGITNIDSMIGKNRTTQCGFQLVGVNSDRFPQLPAKTFHSLTHSDRVSVIQCAGSVAEEMSSAMATRLLLKRGYLVQIQEENGCLIPVMHTVPINSKEPNSTQQRVLPIPGKRYRSSAVCADARLNQGSRSHQIISNHIGSHRVMIISKGYKNDFGKVIKSLASMDNWEQGNYVGQLYDKDSPGSITIYGSGGAPNLPGAYAPTAKANSRDEPSLTFPLCQSTRSHVNSALIDMTARNEVVTVYVNESMFLPYGLQKKRASSNRGPPRKAQSARANHAPGSTVKSKCVTRGSTVTKRRRLPMSRRIGTNPNVCRCLGAFEMHSLVYQRDSAEEIRRSQSEQGQKLNLFSRFKEVPYLRFHLHPLLDNDSVNRLATDPTTAARMKLLTIPRICDDEVNVYVSTDWMRNILSMDGDIPIMRDDLIEHFIESGGLYKFGYELGHHNNRQLGENGSRIRMGIYGEDEEQMNDADSQVIDHCLLENCGMGDKIMTRASGRSLVHGRMDNESYSMQDDTTVTSSSTCASEGLVGHGRKGNESYSMQDDATSTYARASWQPPTHGNVCDSNGERNNSSAESSDVDDIDWMDARSNASADDYGTPDKHSTTISTVSRLRTKSDCDSDENSSDCDSEENSSETGTDDSGSRLDEDVTDENTDLNRDGRSTDTFQEMDTNEEQGGVQLGNGWTAHLSTTKAAAKRRRKQGTIASLGDLLAAMRICQYSGANRYLCRNLVYIGKHRCASPLDGTKAPLPSVFVFRPMPMPNRAMDGIAMCLQEDAMSMGILKQSSTSCFGHDRVKRPFLHDELIQITFKAIVLRFTGRLLPHSLYAKKCGKKTWCPGVTDVEEYLTFMKKTLPPTNENGSISQWLSEQHLHSIPLSTKNFGFFSRFLRAVVLLLPDVVMQMMSVTNTREQAVILLGDHLKSCCVSSKQDGNLVFLAQQIVADVEEIFDFPYGPVTAEGMKSGSGSFQGYEMMRNGDLTTADFSTVLSSVVSYFEQRCSDEDLMILGYRRVGDVAPIVMLRNVVNGRPFNYTDAEHFLCKGWIIAKYTFPQNTASVQPISSRPHCHPIKIVDSVTFQLPNVTAIMNDIIDSFEAMSDRGYDTPQFCLMAGETGQHVRHDRLHSATDDTQTDDSRKPAARVTSPTSSKRSSG